jgi:hypothetical protein
MLFLFPRSERIEAADSEVSFETSAGTMKVKSKFKLKDMQYGGQLSL